jgi:hypothetical protein
MPFTEATMVAKFGLGTQCRFRIGKKDFSGKVIAITFYEDCTTYRVTTGSKSAEYWTIPEKDLEAI